MMSLTLVDPWTVAPPSVLSELKVMANCARRRSAAASGSVASEGALGLPIGVVVGSVSSRRSVLGVTVFGSMLKAASATLRAFGLLSRSVTEVTLAIALL